MLVPSDSAAEAAVVEGIEVIPISSLSQAVGFLSGEIQIEPTPSRLDDLFRDLSTYDVDFSAAQFDADGKKTKNARLTVRHNGVLIHDNIEVPKSTTAAPLGEGPEDGPLHFQNHGNPVRYRNIWIVKK